MATYYYIPENHGLFRTLSSCLLAAASSAIRRQAPIDVIELVDDDQGTTQSTRVLVSVFPPRKKGRTA